MKTVLSVFLLLNNLSVAQINDEEMIQLVLNKGVEDSTFVFGKWKKSGDTELNLNYLGQVQTNDGRIFKLINYSFYWGLSHRASSSVLIYNDKNQYVGNYGLSHTEDLPVRLENGYLIFTNYGNSDCDKRLITKVNFNKGLPKHFFLKCKGEDGDSYNFSGG